VLEGDPEGVHDPAIVRQGSVFDKLPDWATKEFPRAGAPWAPYHLYYAVSSFGSNESAIGLATTQTLSAPISVSVLQIRAK
jgi:hypothetical protein